MPYDGSPEARARKAAYDKIYKGQRKALILAQAKAYREANPEKVRAAVNKAHEQFREKYRESHKRSYRRYRAKYEAWAKAWKLANPDKRRKIARDWHKNHPEQSKALSAKWKANNHDKCMIYKHRRRARVLGCLEHHTEAEWRAVLGSHGGKCAYCGQAGRKGNPITRDHLTPISQGGSNKVSNLVPACKSCNSKKHDRDAIKFVREELGWLL